MGPEAPQSPAPCRVFNEMHGAPEHSSNLYRHYLYHSHYRIAEEATLVVVHVYLPGALVKREKKSRQKGPRHTRQSHVFNLSCYVMDVMLCNVMVCTGILFNVMDCNVM